MARKYKLGERLGRGGVGEVFRAELFGEAGFRRPVAIKRLHVQSDPVLDELFAKEARLCSHLNHPNVVSVLDFDRDEQGRLLLVMELVEGVDLAELIQLGRVPRSIAIYVVAEVLRALAYAHACGVVHRDVSPHNVLISWNGDVKLSDFGLAKEIKVNAVSQSGQIKGKIGYISPDQLLGLELDGRADLFSVGAMLYELVTGDRPFGNGTVAESVGRILSLSPARPGTLCPDLPEALDDLIMRMLERDRSQRIASAHEVIEALQPSDGPSELAGFLHERRAILINRRSVEGASHGSDKNASELPSEVASELPSEVASELPSEVASELPSVENVTGGRGWLTGVAVVAVVACTAISGLVPLSNRAQNIVQSDRAVESAMVAQIFDESLLPDPQARTSMAAASLPGVFDTIDKPVMRERPRRAKRLQAHKVTSIAGKEQPAADGQPVASARPAANVRPATNVWPVASPTQTTGPVNAGLLVSGKVISRPVRHDAGPAKRVRVRKAATLTVSNKIPSKYWAPKLSFDSIGN